MGTGRRLVVGLILCIPAFAAGMREDTAHMAGRLFPMRAYKVYEFTSLQFQSVRAEYLAWIDSRVRAGNSAAMINAELREANLLSDGPRTIEDQLDKTYAGYFGTVRVGPIQGADELMAVTLGIYTGGFCNRDETVAIYQRAPLLRLGWLNAERSYTHGYYLASLAASKDNPLQGRIVASAWTATNCTSAWNGGRFRIDLFHGAAMRDVLNTGVTARNDEEIQIGIRDKTVTFRYITGMRDLTFENRPGVSSFQIRDDHVTRQGPIASHFGGFIDEWLLLDDEDAARFSSPAAARLHRELAARFKKEPFDWQHAADCPGPAREIAVRGDESEKTTVFLIASSSIAEMRMLSISDRINPSCREIDIRKDLSAITSGPSH